MCEQCEDQIYRIYSSILTQFDLHNINPDIGFRAIERLHITLMLNEFYEEELDQYLSEIREFCHRAKKFQNRYKSLNEGTNSP